MRHRVTIGLLLVLYASARTVYRNPVICGDFPDPSVTRVDKNGSTTYWAATTGGEVGVEAFPLFHSKDLIHWQRAKLQYVFPSPPSWTQGDYWAPEISSNKGVFYVFYSALCDMANSDCQAMANNSKNPHCLGYATAPSGDARYRDAGGPVVCDEWGSIDPMVLWEQARQYLIWKEDANHCECGKRSRIWAQEFVISGEHDPKLKFVGPRKCLLENDPHSWEDAVVEAPFLMRHGRRYYLFYSGALFGGVDCCHYSLGVARASTPLGEYVKDSANSLNSDNACLKFPGHGSIVTTPGGQTFLLHHAYPRKQAEENHRDVVLDEIQWKPDGWPIINDYRGVAA